LGVIDNIYIEEPENCTRIKVVGTSCDRDILIDSEEKEALQRYTWVIQNDMGKFYAVPFNFKSGYEDYRMVNKILAIRPSGRLRIKYKNENTLDNRKKNLILEAKGLLHNEYGKMLLLDFRVELDDEEKWNINVYVQGREFNHSEDSKECPIEEAYMRAIKKIKLHI
jgi:hypothetical protein